MTACSYFAGKEYPGFMKFFYTVYFLCGFISIINLVITMCQMFKYLVGCYKKHNKNMFLPSKVEAIPECTQASRCADASTSRSKLLSGLAIAGALLSWLLLSVHAPLLLPAARPLLLSGHAWTRHHRVDRSRRRFY
jgi:hypothetical protein